MKRCVISKSEGLQLPNDEFIKDIEEGEGFKYSGLLEVVRFKEKVRKEYFCCTKKILKPKLNSGNVVTTISSRAVTVIW